MNLKSKIKDLAENINKVFNKLQNTHLSDLQSFYRKFLKRIPDIFHLKNIVLIGGGASLLIFILFNQRFESLYNYLPKEPVSGGIYTEGVVGEINQLNPLFSQTSSAEIVVDNLIFSGLTKKNNKKQIIPDLAEKWVISTDGKVYTFTLKNNIFWHDKEPVTVDDILFTIETIQNPDTRTPLLKIWRGVTPKKIDDKTISFTLEEPYSGFLSNTEVLILPKHILADVPAKSLKTAEFSNTPIGTGPYIFEKIKNIRDSQEVTLLSNKNYYNQTPYIEKVIIKTYNNFSDLPPAYARREILGLEKINGEEVSYENELPNANTYNLAIPETDTLYFNLRSGVSKEKFLREAIALSIPRDEIIKKVYNNDAMPIFAPILTGYVGYNSKLKQNIDTEAAKKKILDAGYTLDANNMMIKDGEILTVRLVCLDEYNKVFEAEIIKENLKKIGINIEIEKYPRASFFQEYVKNRNFDILLISQNLGFNSDIYSFWHSTQVNDPGLNFSGLSDRKVDKFLEQARTTLDIEKRKQRYQDVQQIILDEVASLPLVWPNYIYAVSREVKGISNMKLSDPKYRFWNIEKWYIYDKKATIL